MTDVLEKIPAKILIGIVLFVLVFMTLLITYSVAVQNRPIEIWGIKIGETDDELRARLRKVQAESDSKVSKEIHQNALNRLKEADSKIAPEVHQAALARLKEAESKASLPSPESSKLRSQLKERDDKIGELTKQLTESKRINEILAKDLADVKGKIEVVTVELHGSQKNFSEISRQHKDQTKKLEEMVSLEKRNILTGYIRQFEDLEKRSGTTIDDYIELSYVRQFNDVLTALKKELPNDIYIQNVTPLWLTGNRHSFSSSLKSTGARIRVYLEQRYLK